MPPPNIDTIVVVAGRVAGFTAIQRQAPAMTQLAVARAFQVVQGAAVEFHGELQSAADDRFIAVFQHALDAAQFSMFVHELLMVVDWPDELESYPETRSKATEQGQWLYRGLRFGMAITSGPARRNQEVLTRSQDLSTESPAGQTLITKDVFEHVALFQEHLRAQEPAMQEWMFGPAGETFQLLPQSIADRFQDATATLY